MSRPRTWLKVGRWCGSFTRYSRARWAVRSGGKATPGPWWELSIGRVGWLRLSHDRTLFGWDDPANTPRPPGGSR